MMIDILKREVEELTEREQKLQRINDTLMEAVRQKEHTCSQDVNWKNKYNEQAKINQ